MKDLSALTRQHMFAMLLRSLFAVVLWLTGRPFDNDVQICVSCLYFVVSFLHGQCVVGVLGVDALSASMLANGLLQSM